MTVLVTGASGFIGRNLVQRLSADGQRVRATFRTAGHLPLPLNVEPWILPDLNEPGALLDALAGMDTVVHLAALAHEAVWAAQSDAEIHRVNTGATRLLARAAATCGLRRFVFMSSVAAVGVPAGGRVDDTTSGSPQGSYGASKLAAENALIDELGATGVDWCILRPPLVYGPGNPGNMRRLLALMRTGLPLPFAAIRNQRSFIYIDNLVDAVATVLQHKGAIRDTYLISDGSDFSTPGLVRALARAADLRVRMLPVAPGLLRGLGCAGDRISRVTGRPAAVGLAAIESLTGSHAVDGRRFAATFNWQAPVPVEVAIALTARALLTAGPALQRSK